MPGDHRGAEPLATPAPQRAADEVRARHVPQATSWIVRTRSPVRVSQKLTSVGFVTVTSSAPSATRQGCQGILDVERPGIL